MTKVQQLGTEIYHPVLESLRSGQEKQAKAIIHDGDLAAALWMDQGVQNGSACIVDPRWQLESLFSPISSQSVSEERMRMEEEAKKRKQPEVSDRAPAPASPDSSDSSYHQQANHIPRHKRPSHRRAELKRRDKIKSKLDELKFKIPYLADKGKMSECSILSKAADYTKHLLGECERFSTEAGNFRREIQSLCSDIHSLQGQLPATGVNQEVVDKSQNSLDKMYSKYCTDSIKANWKFYVFNFIMEPMFQSFKESVSSDKERSFAAAVEDWTNTSLSLYNLRQLSLEKMRDISRKTAIMNNPESLPEQARASVALQSDSAGSSSPPPPSTVPHVLTPVSSTPSFSDVTHLSAPVVLAPSMASHIALSAAPVPPASAAPAMSAPVVLAPSMASHIALPAAPVPPSASATPAMSAPAAVSSAQDACLSTLLALASPSPKDPPSSSIPLSHSDLYLPSPMDITSSSSELAHLLASTPSVSSFSAQPVASLPATKPQSLPSAAIPRTTVQQNLFPQFLLQAGTPATTEQDQRLVQNHRHEAKAGNISRRKRSSGHSSSGISSGNGDESTPVVRRRESLDCPRVPVPVQPVRPYEMGMPASREPPAQQQPMGAIQIDTSDIGQLVASVQETTLHVHPPVAVVTPTLPLVEQFPPSMIAHFLNNSQYDELDFDLTDIPLPDL